MNEPVLTTLSPATHYSRRMRARRWLRRQRGRTHIRLRLVQAIARALPVNLFGRARAALLRLLGADVDERALVYGVLELHGADLKVSRLHIGRTAWISPRCQIDLSAEVWIEAGVSLGHDVAILTADHAIGPPEQRCGPLTPKPVVIGRGTWIGARSTIMPGVTIGPGCVVSAGSTVFRDVPANTVVGGSPARAIRTLADGGADTAMSQP